MNDFDKLRPGSPRMVTAAQREERAMKLKSPGAITIEVTVYDPAAADAIKMLADRSNAGFREYGNPSVMDGFTTQQLISEAVEESVDQLIYLLGAYKKHLKEIEDGQQRVGCKRCGCKDQGDLPSER